MDTKFRGEFLIQASKTIDKKACERNIIDPKSLITGAIIGKAILYDVKSYDSKNSFLRDKNKHLEPRYELQVWIFTRKKQKI